MLYYNSGITTVFPISNYFNTTQAFAKSNEPKQQTQNTKR